MQLFIRLMPAKVMRSREICEVTMASSWIRLIALTLILLLDVSQVSCQPKGSMTCSSLGSFCPAYLYYRLRDSDTQASVASLFSVSQNAIKQYDTNSNTDGVIVSLQCLCSDNWTYLAEAAYRANSGDTQESIATGPYEYLASITRQQGLVDGQLMQIDLFCGCIRSLGQPLLTYVVQIEDTLESLAIRFKTSTMTIMNINNITEQDNIVKQTPYYIPIHDSVSQVMVSHKGLHDKDRSAQGLTVLVQLSKVEVSNYDLKPAVILPQFVPNRPGGREGIALGRIVGIVLAALLSIAAVAAMVFVLQKRKVWCYKDQKLPFDSRSARSNSYDARTSFGRAVSQKPSWSVLVSLLQCGPWGHDDGSLNVKHNTFSSLSKDRQNVVTGEENPEVFDFAEIVAATTTFPDSNRIMIGAYGTVYFGLLRGQEVVVRKMKATKTNQFLAELKTACKVHHTNIVELIGYSLRGNDVFLIYECAENGAVRARLHDPHTKGFPPLTWNARVQIALDAARGLGCIHDHSTGHYVHGDVNTGKILLDSSFRAKVADFGLTKLTEQSEKSELAMTWKHGTLGYLAPECVRDSQATTKSDVYAFGVVLFELITGKGAIHVDHSSGSQNCSLISLMLSALSDCTTFSEDKLKAIVDPLLHDMYPFDSVLKMATLGYECVKEDLQDRPDMKLIILTLTQILFASMKWEASLAGSSQIFSSRIQGR